MVKFDYLYFLMILSSKTMDNIQQPLLTPQLWCIIHTICFINSCILMWVISKVIPVYINDTVNPALLFGLFPFIASIIIRIFPISRKKTFKVMPIS